MARRYRDEIMPLRRQIGQENLLRYNGMVIGGLELLSDAQEQARSVRAGVAALHDFWIADLDLSQALAATTERTGVVVASLDLPGASASP